jgi:hypothetical protein
MRWQIERPDDIRPHIYQLQLKTLKLDAGNAPRYRATTKASARKSPKDGRIMRYLRWEWQAFTETDDARYKSSSPRLKA